MKERPPRPRTDFSYVSTSSLISAATLATERPNVRLMEELLGRGPDQAPGMVAVLNFCVSRKRVGHTPLWLAVVAGESKATGAVAALLTMLRTAPEHDDLTLVVAAEALAKIGRPAVAGLGELTRTGDWWCRIWAYAALGWSSDPGASAVLLSALEEEELLADVVVRALADRGDPTLVPALLDALATCHPRLRLDLEGAIRDLHHDDQDRPVDRDWRLRYRLDPEYGQVDTGWPASAAMFREDDGSQPPLTGPPPPVRSLAEILAHREPVFGVRVDPDGNPICDCCDARMWVSTGVWVCPATAMTVAWIQDRWLTRARNEARLDDLFDVLDLLEDELHALYQELTRPETPWDQDEVEPSIAVAWAWRGVCWLIEKGIEDVQVGGERIREEARRLVGLEAMANGSPESARSPSLN